MKIQAAGGGNIRTALEGERGREKLLRLHSLLQTSDCLKL